MADTGACLVIGAGDDTGAAVGRAFAREGLVACLVRRERHANQLEMLAQSIRDEGLEALAGLRHGLRDAGWPPATGTSPPRRPGPSR